MAQGKSKLSNNGFIKKKRNRHESKPKKKNNTMNTKDHTGIRENNEIEKQIKKKINQHQNNSCFFFRGNKKNVPLNHRKQYRPYVA